MFETHIEYIFNHAQKKSYHLPPLPPMGGNFSVFPLEDKKTRITFDQEKEIFEARD